MAYLLVSFCCAFVALGSFLFGYDSGVISSSIAQPPFVAEFGGALTDAVTGGIVSSYTGGAIVGSAIVSFISDTYGRRIVVFLGGLLATLGGALQGGCVTLAMLIAGRFIAGVAVGMMSATIPVYCSEVAPPRIRGLLAGMQQWMVGVGIMVAQWVGYGCSLYTDSFSWRFPLSFQVIPALLISCGTLFVPETPRWLIEHCKEETARAVLTRLHLNRAGSNRDLVEHEFQRIRETIAVERRTVVRSWRQLLMHPQSRRRVLLACGIQAFTQCSGTNVIQYYGPRIYATLGLSTSTSLMIIGIWGALAVFWNTVFMSFIDRVGRRKLLIPSMLGMGATLCVEATLAHYFDPDSATNDAALRAAISMFFVFTLFFTALGLISWVYPSEIFPTAIRARGTSLSTLTNWSLNLVFAQCGPIGLSQLGYRFFYCFTAFNWAGAAIVWLCYPETVGRSLEDVGEIFGDIHTLRDDNSNNNDDDGDDNDDGGGDGGDDPSRTVRVTTEKMSWPPTDDGKNRTVDM
ncbi:hypothetical protein VTN77DRAFT_5824 [Rasamsonia byssochlamydoides]|uniref:uncharacterized protein n=1 Tax=Rasamsonia byssochlamydoides TaxID=89139 RepID=UPI003743A6F9